MKRLSKGQKLSLLPEIGSLDFRVDFTWSQGSYSGETLESGAFIFSDSGKIESEKDLISQDNPVSSCQAISLIKSPNGENKSFAVNLSRLSPTSSRVMFVLMIDPLAVFPKYLGDLQNIGISISNLNTDKKNCLEYRVENITKETILIMIEFYKRNEEWKIQAVGNGFNFGLSAFLREYGSEKVKTKKNFPIFGKLKKESKQTYALEKQKIELTKKILENKGDSAKIDLNKKIIIEKQIHVNLNWNRKKRSGIFFRKEENLDLDLGCMFELKDGDKGVIQALGGSMGSRYTPPYIYLDKDDRSGDSDDGENLYILRPDLVKKMIVFCFIYDGITDFMEAGAYLTIRGLNQEITINLDSPRRNLTFCVGTLLESENEKLKIAKIDEYFTNHVDCARAFGFNFRWIPTAKD